VWFSRTCRIVVHQEVRKLPSKVSLMEPSPPVLVSSANRKLGGWYSTLPVMRLSGLTSDSPSASDACFAYSSLYKLLE